jgi:ClpP class serine protease
MVASGDEKLDGSTELKITSDEKERMKKRVEEAGQSFRQDVARARKVSVEAISGLNGRVLNASEALELGLIDGIMEYNDLLSKYSVQAEPDNNIVNMQVKINDLSVNLNHIDPNQDDQMDDKVLNQIQALSEQVGALKAEVGTLRGSNSELQAQNDKAKAIFADSAMLGIQQATGAAVSPEKEAELKSKSLSAVIEESQIWQAAAKNQVGNRKNGVVAQVEGVKSASDNLSPEAKVEEKVANEITAIFENSKYSVK